MRLTLPVSILLASVIVALGLYFGLRRPPVEATPTHEGEGPAVAGPPTAPRSSSGSPPGSPPGSPVRSPPGPTPEQIAIAVTNVVVEAHPRWKAACWDTADPATRTPGRYTASLAFDASGALTISGVGEHRGESDASVAHCLRQQLNVFRIPAPGYPVSYDVPYRMP